MRKQAELSYTAQMIRNHSRDRFLACLFVPQPARDGVFAVYALDAELAHLREATTETLMRQIRYAWWEEALAAMAAGQPPKEHPVLESLAKHNVPLAPLVQLVATHREHESGTPSDAAVDGIVAETIQTACPQAELGWRKARAIIESHRQRYGQQKILWLGCKLLWAGI